MTEEKDAKVRFDAAQDSAASSLCLLTQEETANAFIWLTPVNSDAVEENWWSQIM